VAPDLDLVARIRREAEVARLRARNGIKLAAGRRPPRAGLTPYEVVWSSGKTQLWRYRGEPGPSARVRPPIVLVHSLVSRSYVLDLHPGNSLVEELLAAGADVFLLDWGVADEKDAANTLETYVDEGLPPACHYVAELTGRPVNIVGYCLGGILALLYAARHAGSHLATITTLAAPIDFDQLGMVVSMLRDGRISIDDLLDETGNIPPTVFRQAFRLMQPTAEVTQYVNLLQNLWNDDYVDSHQIMSRWVGDHIPFPGALARQAVDLLIRNNSLYRRTLVLGGVAVDLGAISCPVVGVLAERDHIVPAAAAEPLSGLITGAPYQEVRLSAGHVALVMGRQAKKTVIPAVMDHVRVANGRDT
jgi:polyhydroxyalkanoate synthase subunit PhaC